MRIAWRELVRRPSKFLSVGGALTLLVLLLVVLGGFLDGLTLNQTGAYRAQGERLLVFSQDSDLLLARSRIDHDTRGDVEAVEGVASVGGLGTVTTAAEVEGHDELVDVAVFGYEQRTDVLPEPPAAGEAIADDQLDAVAGLTVGDLVTVGVDGTGLETVGFVDDTTAGVPTLWTNPGAWRAILAEANPTAALREGEFQALVVTPAAGTDVARLAARIDDATGSTATATVDEVIDALPAVSQQASTFQGIIGVTFMVTLLVVALFFALITIERRKLYAVLKALGGRSSDLLAGLAVQAVGISLGAVVLGIATSAGFVALLPPELPVRLEPSRLVAIAVGTLVTALVGSLFTLRRILAVDPAEAIG